MKTYFLRRNHFPATFRTLSYYRSFLLVQTNRSRHSMTPHFNHHTTIRSECTAWRKVYFSWQLLPCPALRGNQPFNFKCLLQIRSTDQDKEKISNGLIVSYLCLNLQDRRPYKKMCIIRQLNVKKRFWLINKVYEVCVGSLEVKRIATSKQLY